MFSIGEKCTCLNGKDSSEQLVPGWEYDIVDIHPETGGLRLKDGHETSIYWKRSRFGRHIPKERKVKVVPS